MRDANGVVRRIALAAVVAGAVTTLTVLHPLWAGVAVAALVASLLVPPTLLALLLRVIKVRDRHAYFRLARPALLRAFPAQAFPPTALGNSSGGRNVS